MIAPRIWLRCLAAGLGLAALCGGRAAQDEFPAVTAATPAPPAPGGGAILPAKPADFALTGELTQGGWARGAVPLGATGLTLAGAPVVIAADGSFIIAFDRDAPGAALLSARLADGRPVSRQLTIAPRAWKIEHINVARLPGGPTAEFMAKRQPELARISAARKIAADSQGWRQSFIWPVRGRLSGMFGSQRVYRGEPASYHSGTDIATGASGTPFVAPADGVVILAAETPFTLEGHLLMIDHGMGLNSAFLHCAQLMVKEGQKVRQGQVIGRIGMTGRATGPHLHWSIKWNSARLDPILFTGPMR